MNDAPVIATGRNKKTVKADLKNYYSTTGQYRNAY
jgi:hypothetical protein